MVYQKTTWSDRQVQKPLTFTMTNNADGTVTLTPAEGTITQPGTPITAAALNNIENGVANALDTTIGGTVNGDVNLNNNLNIGGTGKYINFKAGRTNNSNITWNANVSSDFGLNFNVDGQQVVSMTSDGSLNGLQNSFNVTGQQDINIMAGNLTNGSIRLRSNNGNGIYCNNYAASAFMPINASAFNVNSDLDMKKNVTPFTENAENIVNSTTVYQYNYDNELDSEPKHTGLIMQYSPVEVNSINGVGVDVYAMAGVLWKSVQELSAKVADLESRVSTLESK